MNLRRFAIICAATAALLASTNAAEQKISLVGGTLINPGTSQVLDNAVIIIAGDHIAAIRSRKDMAVPTGSKWIDCKGKFILPGYIDTHVHFFQSGDLFTRPDIVDLNSVRPYKEEIAWIKSHLNDTFARYLRSGI